MKNDYHGGCLEGNDCRKLLNNQNISGLCPENHENFVATFSSLNGVVSSCYGSALHPNYKSNIAKFKRDHLRLKVSITPKVHTVFYHIEVFCTMKGMGLAPWSEQTGESLHHEFNTCWEKYIVKDPKKHYTKHRALK